MKWNLVIAFAIPLMMIGAGIILNSGRVKQQPKKTPVPDVVYIPDYFDDQGDIQMKAIKFHRYGIDIADELETEILKLK